MYRDSFASEFSHINLKKVLKKKTFTIPFNDTIIGIVTQQWAGKLQAF